MRIWEVVPCRYCGAERYEVCTWFTGEPFYLSHLARVRDWQKLVGGVAAEAGE